MGWPCRAIVARRMIALSPACRWISVSMTSGASRVKAPSPLIGGSWPGSPSTRLGLPNASRSAAISAPNHRHLVQDDQPGVADDRLFVEHEPRLVDVVEAK